MLCKLELCRFFPVDVPENLFLFPRFSEISQIYIDDYSIGLFTQKTTFALFQT